MKYRELLEEGKRVLIEAKVNDYEFDSFLLFEHVFGISKADYFIKMNSDIDDGEKTKYYTDLVNERANGKPLQYITGHQEFMGLDFTVNENVLIPRYDTEILVENVINYVRDNYNGSNIRVLDMCTGSGCIGISVAKLANVRDVTCVDISPEALKVAKHNASNNEVSYINFIESDLFNKLNVDEKFDIIISNPPYIRTEEIDNLMTEVKFFEPNLALDGDKDGLKFYRIITKHAASFLKEGGMLAYEIGYDQGKQVSDLMMERGFVNVKIIKDLAGLDRVVTGNLNIGGNEDV